MGASHSSVQFYRYF